MHGPYVRQAVSGGRVRVLIFSIGCFSCTLEVLLQPKEGMVALTAVGLVGIPLRGAQSPTRAITPHGLISHDKCEVIAGAGMPIACWQRYGILGGWGIGRGEGRWSAVAPRSSHVTGWRGMHASPETTAVLG